ncbi:MAG: YdiU family protein [Pseudomonadota bacterium]
MASSIYQSHHLSELSFENTFVDSLPADPSSENRSRQILNACYTFVTPTPVAAPRLVAWSDDVAVLLGILKPDASDNTSLNILAGNAIAPGMKPYASRYGGHQFGHWAGQLGDGRAITLSERVYQNRRWELQLKGAGKTPYSRFADGRAVLRSSLREFLCSEAMFYLGIPTTRALSLVTTGDTVVRDMFYDGHPQEEPGAIVCRVAPTFIRFGHFEMLAACNEIVNLKSLADYAIKYHFQHLAPASSMGHGTQMTPNIYKAWFKEICKRTALMIVEWMRVGFVHGVMNTDNMSILGLTIDYGPYGWLEGYEPDWTPNTTDAEQGRYAYGQQPKIAHWNLHCLGQALMPLLQDQSALEEGLNEYAETFNTAYMQMCARKLGFQVLEGKEDEQLLKQLLHLFDQIETDMTIFFRHLAYVSIEIGAEEATTSDVLLKLLEEAFYAPLSVAVKEKWLAWLKAYSIRSMQENKEKNSLAQRKELMLKTNPKYVLRNYLAQQAIEAATHGDYSYIEALQVVIKTPYDELPDHETLAKKRPEWARHKPGCSALSCSS